MSKHPSSTRVQSKFADVPRADIKRSTFDRSHGLKTTFGRVRGEGVSAQPENPLVPIFIDEVLPGDTFKMNSTMFARIATPLHPIMDNLYVDVHYFFVPTRLVWNDWQQFMGERIDPDDDPSEFSVPQAGVQCYGTDQTFEEDSLAFYFGLPMRHDGTGYGNYTVNALPFRAYRLIWNEWYRDENFQDSVAINRTSSGDSVVITTDLLPRGKRKDYFTSALPWPQKGDPVHIPVELSGYVDVYGNPQAGGESVYTSQDVTGAYSSPFLEANDGNGTANFGVRAGDQDVPWTEVLNSATINDLRTAFQIQRLLERDARGGTRYTEILLAHFNVNSPDARLQRPEYLGGGTSRVSQNPVANTAGETAPQAQLAAFGTVVNTARFNKSFTEHGYIIGLASYRADLTYQRGIERMWSRQTRYDYYWPALAHLGEQAILNKEIHFRGVAEDDEVFGYQERYGEYRYKPSRVTGLFNSDTDTSLDVWHYAQDFDISQPLPLNEEFIKERPPINRTIAVPSEPYFIADVWFDLKTTRPMPTYAIPGLVDHF